MSDVIDFISGLFSLIFDGLSYAMDSLTSFLSVSESVFSFLPSVFFSAFLAVIAVRIISRFI